MWRSVDMEECRRGGAGEVWRSVGVYVGGV